MQQPVGNTYACTIQQCLHQIVLNAIDQQQEQKKVSPVLHATISTTQIVDTSTKRFLNQLKTVHLTDVVDHVVAAVEENQ